MITFINYFIDYLEINWVYSLNINFKKHFTTLKSHFLL